MKRKSEHGASCLQALALISLVPAGWWLGGNSANTPCFEFPGVSRVLSCQIDNELLFSYLPCLQRAPGSCLTCFSCITAVPGTFAFSKNVAELSLSKGFTQSQTCWKTIDFPSLTISEISNKQELRAIRCFADTVQSALQVEQISLLRWRSLFIKALWEEFCFISPATVF